MLEFGQRDRALELAFELDVDQRPARCRARGFRVEVIAFRIELRRVRVRRRRYRGNADDTGFGAAGVIEEHAIADAHLAQVIARLVIAYAAPGLGLLACQIVDGKLVRFGFHQPMVHAEGSVQSMNSLSVATKSMRTSHGCASSFATS